MGESRGQWERGIAWEAGHASSACGPCALRLRQWIWRQLSQVIDPGSLPCTPCLPTPRCPATVASLIEDQVREAAAEEDAAPVLDALWRAVEAALARSAAAAGGHLPAEALQGAFLDVLLAPGRLSRPALAAALRALGGGGGGTGLPSAEEVGWADLEELRRALPGARLGGSVGTKSRGR